MKGNIEYVKMQRRKGVNVFDMKNGLYVKFSDHKKALTDQSSYYEGRVMEACEELCLNFKHTELYKSIKSIFNTEGK